MARRGRYFGTDQTLHVTQCCNGRQRSVFADEDYQLCCHWLAEAAGPHCDADRRTLILL